MVIQMGRHRSSGRVAVIAVVSLLLLLFSSGHSFSFLPRVAPHDFQKGDELQVKMDELSSAKTQLPYDLYILKYCKPSHEIQNAGEINPGEDLRRTEDSVYNFQMMEDQSCKVACISHIDAQSAKDFKDKIDDEYRANMILDDLPVTQLGERHWRFGPRTSAKYDYGFRIGFKGNSSESNEEKYFIHNHLSFRVMFHKDPDTDSARIVGFEVSPVSLKHEHTGLDEQNNPIVPTCKQHTENLIQAITIPQEVDEEKQIVFTYDVTFKERDIKWASRWDTYLLTSDVDMHWASLFGGLLFSFVGAIFQMPLFPKDSAKYNPFDAKVGERWKLLHRDVFRTPSNSGLLSVYVGTGVQILAMTVVTIILALLGILSPYNLGGKVMTDVVFLWAVIMGLSSGYSSARLYKSFKGRKWKTHALKTAFVFPVILFSFLFVLNALLWEKKSSRAVPIGTMFEVACLWFKMFAPCVFFGSCFGFKRPAVKDPVKTNLIPGQIPADNLRLVGRVLFMVVGGAIPFAMLVFELEFVLTTVWVDKFYNLFGFPWYLCMVFVSFIVVSAEASIAVCSSQLSMQDDYNWWWTSYLTGGMPAVYIFLYSVNFFFDDLEISDVVSVIIYFGCTLVASIALFMMMGSIGFYACLWYVRNLYSTLKVD